jgi:hypothetical protein
VSQAALQQLLTEFAADRLALVQRHEAAARAVAHYDFNNTYQYVVNREETHLSWLLNALGEYGVGLPQPARALEAPQPPKAAARKVEPGAYTSILRDDARFMADFVARWRPRLDAMSHARHQRMLDVILGESLEHQHFFEQAESGFEDLLGRRTAAGPRVGGVMPTRWVE